MSNKISLEQLSALRTLKDSDGWALFVAEHAARFTGLTDKVLDGKTEPEEAERLRQARCRIEQEFMPQVMLNELLKKNEAHAQHELKAIGAKPVTPS